MNATKQEKLTKADYTRGFIRRTIYNGKPVEVTGYGIEVECVGAPYIYGTASTTGGSNHLAPFNGGDGGKLGRIYFGRGTTTPNPDASFEPYVQATPGARELVYFDSILYSIPLGATGTGCITVKIYIVPRTAWMASEPTGKPRVRWLSSSRFFPGGDGIAAGGTRTLIDMRTPVPSEDRFWTEERYEEKLWWYGFVGADVDFDLYIFVRVNPLDPSSGLWFCGQIDALNGSATAPAAVLTAAGTGARNGFYTNFVAGGNVTLQGNTNLRFSYPGGSDVVMIFHVPGGTPANKVEWQIGVVAMI